MRINVENTEKILKEVEKEFGVHIPFSEENHKNFLENFLNTDSLPKDEYQDCLQSYINGNGIFTKIVKNRCKDNAEFFGKQFPEFKDNFYSEKFLKDTVDFAGDFDLQVNLDERLNLSEMIETICYSVEHAFFKEIAFSLIRRDCDKSKVDNIIKNNKYTIECKYLRCSNIDDVYDVARSYII